MPRPQAADSLGPFVLREPGLLDTFLLSQEGFFPYNKWDTLQILKVVLCPSP